jgi:hypothetical protein
MRLETSKLSPEGNGLARQVRIGSVGSPEGASSVTAPNESATNPQD